MRASLSFRNSLVSLAVFLFFPFAGPAAAVDGVWRSLGPDGGPVYSLAFQPGSSRVIYAGGGGAIYKSMDGGATWTDSSRGLGLVSPVLRFAFDAAHRSTVYAAQEDGLFKSLDGGQTWTQSGPGTNLLISDVATHPTVSGTVYVTTVLGVHRSTDGGATWKRLTRGLPKPYYSGVLVAVDPFFPNRVYLSIRSDRGNGLFRSDDGGDSWRRIRERTARALALDPQSPGTLYAGIGNDLFGSTNGGRQWQRLGSPGAIQTLLVHPTQRNVFYAGTAQSLFLSVDGGRTWTRLLQGLPEAAFQAIALSPLNPQALFTGAVSFEQRAGVYRSTDGGASWELSSKGISALWLLSLAVHPRTPGTLWVVANNHLFQSTDGGATWVPKQPDPADALVREVLLDPIDGSTVYVLRADGKLRRSRDGGQTWEPAATPAVGLALLLVVDPQAPSTLYAAGGSGVAKSTDGGTTWSRLPGEVDLLSAFDLEISPSSPATLYAGGSAGFKPRILRTTDGGATWVRAEQGLPGPPFSLAVDPLVSTTVFAAWGSNIYRSDNGGDSWSLFSDAFRNQGVFPLATSVRSPNLLYAGVSLDNVYQITVGATQWEPLGESPDHPFFATVVPDPHDPCRVYAGTGNRGLLVFTKSGCQE